MQVLSAFAGQRTEATDINDRGEVSGTVYAAGGGSRAFWWSTRTGRVRLLPLDGGSASVSIALNDRGVVLGSVQDPDWTPTIWNVRAGTDRRLTELDDAQAINNRGWVAGTALYLDGSRASKPLVWRPSGSLVELPFLAGDDSALVTGINDQGEVVGTSMNVELEDELFGVPVRVDGPRPDDLCADSAGRPGHPVRDQRSWTDRRRLPDCGIGGGPAIPGGHLDRLRYRSRHAARTSRSRVRGEQLGPDRRPRRPVYAHGLWRGLESSIGTKRPRFKPGTAHPRPDPEPIPSTGMSGNPGRGVTRGRCAMSQSDRGTPERGGAKSLDRAVIVDAAIRYIDQHGAQGLTMRGLGHELGVEAMALYRYVSGREDLLEAVVAKLLEGLNDDLDPVLAGSWQGYLQTFAHAVRRIAVEHSAAFPLVATRHPATPWLRPPLRSIELVEDFLHTLSDHGFTDEQVVDVYRAFSSFLLGQLLLESAVRGADTSPVEEPMDEGDAQLPNEDGQVNLSDSPTIARMQSLLSDDRSKEEFEIALETLLDRLEMSLSQ